MRMSCNGCRVLRKGCSESCVLRPCLQWISTADSQANATIFLAKYYGRTGLANLISSGPEHLRPAIFRSLLYEACGRMVNPIYGSLGLLCSGNWAVCQAAVESILRGDSASQIHPMEAISGKQLSVHARGRFKSQSYSKHKRRKGIDRVPNNYYIGSSSKSDDRSDVTNALHNPDNSIFNEKNIEKHSAIMAAPEQDEFVAATQSQFEYSHDLCSLITSETEAEAPCDAVELELTLGSQRASSPPSPDKFLPGDLRFSEAHWDQYIENFLR